MRGKVQKFSWLLAILLSPCPLAAEETKTQEDKETKRQEENPLFKTLTLPFKECATCKNSLTSQLNNQLEKLRKDHKEVEEEEKEAKRWKGALAPTGYASQPHTVKDIVMARPFVKDLITRKK